MAKSAASKTETVTLRLEDRISAGAAAAESAVLRLEKALTGTTDAEKGLDAAIKANQLGRLETSISRDRESLFSLQAELHRTKSEFESLKSAEISNLEKSLVALEAEAKRARAELSGIASGEKVVNLSEYRAAEVAVKKLGDQITDLQGKLSKTRGSSSEGQEKTIVDKILSQQNKLVEQQEKLARLKQQNAQENKKGAASLNEFGNAARSVGGPVGGLASRVAGFIERIKTMNPIILVSVAVLAAWAATAAVVAVAIGSVIAVIKKGITSADEYRDKILDLASAGVTLWNAQRSSEYQARLLSQTIDEVSGHVAIARDEVEGYARQIKDSLFFGHAMFSAKETTSVLETMSKVAAGGSKALAGQYLEQARTSKMLGLSLDALNKRMDLKFGAVASAKLLSFGVQMKKLGETIFWAFSGADVEPFLKGLQSVLSLFSKDSLAAHDLRGAITQLVEYAIGKFLDFEIILLSVYVWLLEHRKVYGLLKESAKAAFDAMLEGIFHLADGIPIIGPIVDLMILAFKLPWSKLADDMIDIGKDLIGGLIKGVLEAPERLGKAIISVANRALGMVKDDQEINSPSERWRREVGHQIGEGQALGIEDKAPRVQSAAETALTPERAGAGAGQPTGSASGHVVTFTGCNFGENTESGLRKVILSILEGEIVDATPEPT